VTKDDDLDFETLAAQAGIRVRVGDTISTAPPIDPSTTYTGESVEDVHQALVPGDEGFAYGRNANPTVVLLEQALRRLEGAEDVVAFGSGMAATSTVLSALQLWPGDTVVAGKDLYGVSRSLLTQLGQYEITTQYADVCDVGAVEEALRQYRPKALFFETITNPLLRVPDASALIDLAREHNVITLIDNTFASPYLYRPLAQGADLVIHSATKYLAGHGDATVGAVAASASWGRRVRDMRNIQGGVLSPFEAWLTLRGIRTLAVRMDRQCETANALAQWLSTRTWTQHVYYPGLQSHPQHAIAGRQFGGRFGGMVAFDFAGGREDAIRFIDSLEIITPGTSLGDVESLVLYPPGSSHRTLSEEERREMGIGESLVRLSVGLESLRDLQHDLEQAALSAGRASREV
jgi:cystathionine gamma-synthase/methionine-gamma-lyase